MSSTSSRDRNSAPIPDNTGAGVVGAFVVVLLLIAVFWWPGADRIKRIFQDDEKVAVQPGTENKGPPPDQTSSSVVDSSSPKSVDPASKADQGTLLIRLTNVRTYWGTPQSWPDYKHTGDTQPKGPWIYVDGRLAARGSYSDASPNEFSCELAVPTGNHHVEIAWIGWPGYVEKEFIFRFVTQQVALRSNEQKTVEVLFPDDWRVQPFAVAAKRTPHDETSIRQYEEEVTRLVRLVYHDRTVLALAAAKAELAKGPAKRRVVQLEISEELGGPREVDADQVRVLVHWLKGKYDIPDASRSGSRILETDSAELAAVKNRDNRCLDVLKKVGEDLTEYNAIAKALERAP